ncbi:hypothetical protein ES706_04905 [subsurface metagenome]
MNRISPVTILVGLQLALVLLFSNSSSLGLLWVPQLMGVILFCAFVLECIVRRRSYFAAPTPVKLYIAFVVWAGVTIVLIQGHPDQEVFDQINTLIKVAILTFLFSSIIRTRYQLLVVLWLLIAGFLVTIMLNYDQIAQIRTAEETGRLSTNLRLAGTMGNSNTFGIYAIIIAWIALQIFFSTKHYSRFLAISIVPVVLLVALYTGSRKAMLAVPLSAFAIWWFYFRIQMARTALKKYVLFIVALIIICVSSIWILVSPFGDRILMTVDGRPEDSFIERTDMLKAGVWMWLDYPMFGAGLDQFRVAAGKYGAGYGEYSHSTVIEILVCTGIIGFVLYFGALAMLFWETRKVARTSADKFDTTIAGLLIGVLVIVLFFNLFAVMYYDRFIWPLLGAFSGYIHTVTHSSRALATRRSRR